jgi:hypothetical protein
VTDSGGWIAFLEPGLMEREVWFYLSHSPGYEKKPDGFGYRGARLMVRAGETAEVKLQRVAPAERICRLTGQGIYRDSELLGLPVPLPSMNEAGVMGSDSVQAVPYAGRIFWLWGDTNVPHYPLGNFRTTSAWTEAALEPQRGIRFQYLTDTQQPHRIRSMLPLKEKGAVWLFGLLVVKDKEGQSHMLSHWSRHISLSEWEEHGLAEWDAEKGHFTVLKTLPREEKWRFPRGHAVQHGEWFYFSDGFLYTRVKADYSALQDPAAYEALRYDAEQWQWQKTHAPTTQEEEAGWLKEGKMPAADARYQLHDAAEREKRVSIHGGSVQWNAYRQRWVLIALQKGGKDAPSHLGEVWYAEAHAPDGPWGPAVKVASHPRYSFYNPVHHAFLDEDQGRVIYFEGTYSLEFSGNPLAPARYDYNQLMYRLDLDHPQLKPAFIE